MDDAEGATVPRGGGLASTVQEALFAKASTRELAKTGEIDEVVDHINRFFSQEFFLEELPLPSHEAGYWETAPLVDNPDDKPDRVIH